LTFILFREPYSIKDGSFSVIFINITNSISKLTPEQFYKRSWTNYAGVAYGLSEIERAKKTNKNVEKVIELADEACLKQVDNFMNVCYNYF